MRKRILISYVCLAVLTVIAAALWANLALRHFRDLTREFVWQPLAGDVRELVRESVQEALATDAHDIARQRDLLAAQETAVYINQFMARVRTFPDKFALLSHSLEAVDPKLNGIYCEVGVYRGTTINFIASRIHHIIHGFDSFEGLPETWRSGFEKGAFRTLLPEVRENVRLHKGWFDESLPVWKKDHPGPISFMHLDADLYSSTRTVLDILGDRVSAGTVMQFDEFFNYPGWQQGEYKAFTEFVERRRVKFEYIGYTTGGDAQQVAVRIVDVPSHP